MIERKEIPTRYYLYALPLVLLFSFLVSGVFSYPDLTLANFEEHLEEVLRHFYLPWSWVNDKTPACIGLGFLVWIMASAYVMYRYRNFQTGKEYGNEDWADVADVNARHSSEDDSLNRVLSANLRVATKGDGSLSNNNMLVIGSAGRYKTTSTVMTNLLRCNANYIVLDVKGELMYKCGLYLKSRGYTIRCLNLKDQEKSDKYNPFVYIENEVDLIKLIENIYDALTPDDAMSSDPFWTDGAKMYLMSVFYYVWYQAKKDGVVGSFNQVLKLIDEETTDSDERPDPKQPPKSLLQVRMEKMAKEEGETAAVKYYRKLKEGAKETVRSIVIIVNAKLKLCGTAGLKRILSGDDMNLREFATGVGGTVKKTSGRKLALFMCINDNDASFNFICSMLYTQATEILCRMADIDFKDRGGALPIPLEMWEDEFYAGARPHDTEKLMGVIRSRNISMIPILQSVAQIKALFKSEKWEIIMDNCPVMLFLGAGAGALETHKYISELLGKMTIDTLTDGKNGQQQSDNYNRTGRELMTPSEVRRIEKQNLIIFMEGEYPIFDRKALPWEMPEKIVPFKTAMKMNDEHPDKGYVHPVHVIIDPKTGRYLDQVQETSPVEAVSQIPAGSKTVTLTNHDILYGNYKKQPSDKKTLEEAIRRFMEGKTASEKEREKDTGNGTGTGETSSNHEVDFLNQFAEKTLHLSPARLDLLHQAFGMGIPEETILEMCDMDEEACKYIMRQ